MRNWNTRLFHQIKPGVVTNVFLVNYIPIIFTPLDSSPPKTYVVLGVNNRLVILTSKGVKSKVRSSDFKSDSDSGSVDFGLRLQPKLLTPTDSYSNSDFRARDYQQPFWRFRIVAMSIPPQMPTLAFWFLMSSTFHKYTVFQTMQKGRLHLTCTHWTMEK